MMGDVLRSGDAEVSFGIDVPGASPTNRHDPDKRFEHSGPGRVEWTALILGGFGGFDALLEDPHYRVAPERRVQRADDRDNALYVRITTRTAISFGPGRSTSSADGC